jgi:hypothetical protein
VNLSHLRFQLAQIRREMPAVATNEGAPARNAKRLASIAAQPEGPRRDFAIQIAVRSAANNEDPEFLQAIVDAIGAESIARVFPDGLPTQPIAFLRAAARAWQSRPGDVDVIGQMLREGIAREAVTL